MKLTFRKVSFLKDIFLKDIVFDRQNQVSFPKDSFVENAMTDHVSKILQQWAEVRPDLDCSPMGIIGRLGRLEKVLSPAIDKVINEHGLSRIEFDLLATLRRANQPLTPTELYKTTMFSSGAVSTKLDKLVSQAWVERLHNTEDRRSCRVALTQQGQDVVDRAVEQHVDNEHQLLESLSKQEQETLASLLAKLLVQHEANR